MIDGFAGFEPDILWFPNSDYVLKFCQLTLPSGSVCLVPLYQPGCIYPVVLSLFLEVVLSSPQKDCWGILWKAFYKFFLATHTRQSNEAVVPLFLLFWGSPYAPSLFTLVRCSYASVIDLPIVLRLRNLFFTPTA